MVDKNAVTPLYVQVTNELRKEILSDKYGKSGCIGTHSSLAKRFNVSIRTIREAMQSLEKEGMVVIHQGKGTFVRRKSLVDQRHELNGIMKMLSSMEIDNDVDILAFDVIDIPTWMESDLRTQLGNQTLFIQRKIVVNKTPLCIADIYIPERFCQQIEKEDVEKKTIYRILQDKLDVKLGKGKQLIRAAGASQEIAEKLGIEPNSPVLELERKAFDRQGGLIEYMILTYEASKYCLEVKLDLEKEG